MSGDEGKEFPWRSFSGNGTEHFSVPVVGQKKLCSCVCVAAREVRRCIRDGAAAFL